MKDIFTDIKQWVAAREPFALATVTKTWGSAPRQAGSALAVTKDMKVVGSVSGGCIEAAVIEEAQKALKTGIPSLLSFGVSDETAWSVGLTCGGKVNVFVEKHPAFSHDAVTREIWQALEQAISTNQPVILLTKLFVENYQHLLVYPDGNYLGDWNSLNKQAIQCALTAYQSRQSKEVMLSDQPVMVQVFPRKNRLIIIGAAHISIPLVKFAKDLDFEVIIIDPRQIFAAPDRFPAAPDQLIAEWPDKALPGIDLNEDTYAVLLTHDPKIDDPALHILLKSNVAYIGALGSKKTHAGRVARLQEAGFSDDRIAKIHGPVGLNIGAKNPAEVALSIISQIIQVKQG